MCTWVSNIWSQVQLQNPKSPFGCREKGICEHFQVFSAYPGNQTEGAKEAESVDTRVERERERERKKRKYLLRDGLLETWLWNVSVGVSHFQCCVFVVASKFIYCAYLNICQLRENIYIYIYIYIYYYYYYYSYYYYYMNYFKSKNYLYSIIQNFFLKYSIFFYTCNKKINE